jgi:hypothetical protein
MHFEEYAFGLIKIDGATYEHDVVIDRGQVRKRKNKQSKKYSGEFGHTPLSAEEEYRLVKKLSRAVSGYNK